MITVKELEEAPTIVEDEEQVTCTAQQRESRKRLRNRIRKAKKR